jgi:hypothetical protein
MREKSNVVVERASQMFDGRGKPSNVWRLPPAPRVAKHSYPRIAVCVSGPCSDPQPLRRTAQAILEQEYPGGIVLIIPEGVPPDRQWALLCPDGSRVVIISPRSEASFELDCNTAFAIALELQPAVDFVALLSCGETTPRQWLTSLTKAQEEFDADLVIGPVKAVFDEAPSEWMLSGAFFDRFGIQRGPIPRIPAADNLLVRADVFRSCLPRVFFPKPAPHESEWIDFAYRVQALGFTSVWANDAVVFDFVPKSRMNEEWVIQREYWKAFATARAQSFYQENRLAEVSRRCRAFVLLAAGLMSCSVAWFDQSMVLRARLMLAHAKGMMAGCTSRESREREAA